MSLGIRISALNAEPESAKNTFGRLQFVGKFFEFEQRFDPGEQFLGEYGFAQKVVSAGFDTTHPVFALCQSSDEYKRNEASCRIVLQLAAKLVSRFPWHDHV